MWIPFVCQSNPHDIDTITQFFNVDLAGVNFGDCVSGGVIAVTENTTADILAEQLPEDSVDNAITTGLQTLNQTAGGLGGTTYLGSLPRPLYLMICPVSSLHLV